MPHDLQTEYRKAHEETFIAQDELIKHMQLEERAFWKWVDADGVPIRVLNSLPEPNEVCSDIIEELEKLSLQTEYKTVSEQLSNAKGELRELVHSEDPDDQGYTVELRLGILPQLEKEIEDIKNRAFEEDVVLTLSY